MDSLYHYVGFIVVWFCYWAIIGLISYYLIYIVHGVFKHRIYQSDWYSFYIRRKTLDTEFIRKYYHKTIGNAKYWMFRFRLRNIKRASKLNK